ncbi:CPBP family intramembrane glutamic endopeptidase [Demequina lignilytica]|uniref:CPBP family intramembrane metalloprotease n=1 Tax=Demequina lignilytica TaxID=3051663 RepID=A0AB35MFE7_9MICO|nr:CPBP family intramembrane glutamic endopeptidase [Demequina sp. SYSU T0a273]MDN4482502.1 CPBP family intramembrane metalloprotease [Demequina sp. SYSU T0a273]
MTTVADATPRRMTWPALIGWLVAFLLVPSFVSVIGFASQSERLFPDAQAGLKVAAVHGVGVAIVALAVTLKGWWPAVLRETRRVRAWVWIPTLSLVAVAIPMADWSRVRGAGLGVFAAVALGVLMIAVGEELMFRGVMVVFLRARMGELGVALVSSLLFGLAHVLAGPVQVVFSALLGFVLYFARRVSGGLVVPVLIHLAWDLAVFTSFMTAEPSHGSDASVALALTNVIVVIVLAALWRKAMPASSAAPTAS